MGNSPWHQIPSSSCCLLYKPPANVPVRPDCLVLPCLFTSYVTRARYPTAFLPSCTRPTPSHPVLFIVLILFSSS